MDVVESTNCLTSCTTVEDYAITNSTQLQETVDGTDESLPDNFSSDTYAELNESSDNTESDTSEAEEEVDSDWEHLLMNEGKVIYDLV